MKIVKKITVFDVVLTVILVLLSLLFIYPLWTIFVAAFSEPLDYIKNPLVLFPPKFTFYNFRMLITSASVWLGYRNTLIYVCLTFLTAYALSMRELPFKRAINFLLTLTLFFSGGLIPTYLIVKSYGLLDTVWAMVLPGGIATYNLMITRTYLSQQIPGDLIEAAEVDGAGAVRTFAQIVTPLAKPILAVITLFYASGHWNAWYDAMVYLRSRELYPLQLILREMLINEQTLGMMATEASSIESLYTITLNYAVMVIAILPLLLVFPFVQKFFVKGVMIGAIKG